METRLLPVRTRCWICRGCFGRSRISTDRNQIIAITYKMQAQQRMFREKETFDMSRADYCLYVQNPGSADEVSGEGDLQQVETRLLPVRTRCWISRGCFVRRRHSTDRKQFFSSTSKMLDQQRMILEKKIINRSRAHDWQMIVSSYKNKISRGCFGRSRYSTDREQLVGCWYKSRINRGCFGRRRFSRYGGQNIASTYKMLDQQRMFRAKRH